MLGGFGALLNDAIAKAKSELEKSVDNALGIEQQRDGTGQPSDSGAATNSTTDAAAASTAEPTSIATLHIGGPPDIPPIPGNAPEATPQAKPRRIVKKVVKKVIKSQASEGAGSSVCIAAPNSSSAVQASTTTAPDSCQHNSATVVSSTVEDNDYGRAITASATENGGQSSMQERQQGPAQKDSEARSGWATHQDIVTLHAPEVSQSSTQAGAPHSLSGPADTQAALDSVPEANGTHNDQAIEQQHLNQVQQRQGEDHRSLEPGEAAAPNADMDGWALDAVTGIEQQGVRHSGAASRVHRMPLESLQEAGQLAAVCNGDLAGSSTGAASASLDITSSLPPNPENMSQLELITLVHQLHDAVQARQSQLLRHAEQMSHLQQVVAELQERNEAAEAVRGAAVNGQELDELKAEYEQRIATAERKVYALTKERDALKRGTEKLADYGALLKEKDEIIKQVMEEGEKLAGKQAELEATLRKVRGQLKEADAERDRLASKLSSEESTSEGLRRTKARLERELAAAQEAARAELEAVRQQSDALMQKARAEQAEVEERARESAVSAMAKRLREAEARCEALSESVMELRDALERQRQAADLREEMLKQDVVDLERRCQAAELRHQELTSKLPEATRPLLKQIESMQIAAETQAEAWRAAEGTLNTRIADAEARAAAAAERERHLAERNHVVQAKLAGLEASLSAARFELTAMSERLAGSEQMQAAQAEQLRAAQTAAELAAERVNILMQQLQQDQEAHTKAVSTEREARSAAESDAVTVRRECERRVAELEAQLQEAQAALQAHGSSPHVESGGGPEPPAMAAPGYRWVLVKDGEAVVRNPHGQQPQLQHTSDTGTLMRNGQVLHGQQHQQQQQSAPAGDILSSLQPAGSGSLTGSLPLASELEAMRAALRIKAGEVSSLEAQVKQLEMTRNSLAEELLASAQKTEQATEVLRDMENVRKELEELKVRYVAAVELLGERDEALEELRADLMDVKTLLRDVTLASTLVTPGQIPTM